MCSTLSPLSGCQDVSISAAGLLTLLTPEPVVNILPGSSILKRNPNIQKRMCLIYYSVGTNSNI